MRKLNLTSVTCFRKDWEFREIMRKPQYWYRKADKQGDDYAPGALRSMGKPFTPFSKVTLAVLLLHSMLLFVGSGGSLRTPQQRTMFLGALVGLLCVGVDLYGKFEFGVLLAFSVVNPFFFGQRHLVGNVDCDTCAFCLAARIQDCAGNHWNGIRRVQYLCCGALRFQVSSGLSTRVLFDKRMASRNRNCVGDSEVGAARTCSNSRR